MLEATHFMSTLSLPLNHPWRSTLGMQKAAGPGAQSSAGDMTGVTELLWGELFGSLACLGLFSIAVTVAAYFLGAFRESVQGPPRIEPDQPIWPTILGLAAAFIGLFLGGALVLLALHGGLPPTATDDLVQPPPSTVDGASASVPPTQMMQVLQMSAGSYIAATFVALLTYALARAGGWRGTLGLGPRRLPRGLLTGTLALLVVLPWMLTAGVALQAVRKAAGYSPDAVHEIIRALREHPEAQMIFWGLLSALIVAPLAEEVLFRGFLQTSLVYGLARLFADTRGRALYAASGPFGSPNVEIGSTTAEAARLPPFAQVAGSPGGPVLQYDGAPALAPAPGDPPAAKWRWLGIVLASALFASLHEPWSIPLIFLLSVAFGYLYERTANLWTSIVVHFGFNALNLLFVLPSLL